LYASRNRHQASLVAAWNRGACDRFGVFGHLRILPADGLDAEDALALGLVALGVLPLDGLDERGQSLAQLGLREALPAGDRREGDHLGPGRPFVGLADSGGRQLSRRTGRRFRELLEERRRESRPD
jgi:hypothetical protein